MSVQLKSQSKILFTQEGYDKVAKELEALREIRKPAVEMLTTARDMGDRSENAAYKSARSKLSSIDSRIARTEVLLRRAKIVESKQNGSIDIGSNVTVDDGIQQKKYEIVGSYESDIPNGKLSYMSPIGKALAGKRQGDVVQVTVPAGDLSLKIVDVQ